MTKDEALNVIFATMTDYCYILKGNNTDLLYCNGKYAKVYKPQKEAFETIVKELNKQIDEPKCETCIDKGQALEVCYWMNRAKEKEWHTGEPTEEGLYLIRFKNGSFAVVECRYDEDTEDMRFVQFETYDSQGKLVTFERSINPTSVAWHKIEPYKE